jgi:hypothetical protein
MLSNSNGNEMLAWRFSRIGYTGYFILDAYIPLIVVFGSWIPILILHFLPQSAKVSKIKMFAFSIVHKVT